jgi:hypothetical protein
MFGVKEVYLTAWQRRLFLRQALFNFAPEIGQLDLHFRKAGRLIAVVGGRLDDEAAVFVDQELDQLRLRIDDPILGDAVPGVEVEFFDPVATGGAGDDFDDRIRWDF